MQGAEPLYCTDVFSCSKLDVNIAEEVIKGICDGCKDAGCALVGGETAEMSGFFLSGHYDIVGACTGAIKRDKVKKLLPQKEAMRQGDVLLGLASNGCHSNGFTLIRKIIEKAHLGYGDQAPWETQKGRTVGESLLAPTRIYVKPLLMLVEKDLVKGMAHITGGGLWENIPRMLPTSLRADTDAKLWACPDILKWLKQAGHVDDHEFARTFNTGLGMVLVVDASSAHQAKQMLSESGETVFQIGHLVPRGKDQEGCVVQNMEIWNA